MNFLQQDFFFSYKNVFRFSLVHRFGLFYNSFQIPLLKSLKIFFKVFNIKDLDDVRGFNYAYFIRFFFGRVSFFTKSFSVFHLNITYFSYTVFCFFFSQDVFFPLSFFINDILIYSYRDFYVFKSFCWKGCFFYFRFFDMNVFLEKKTNLGFYNLKDFLRFKLFLTGILYCLQLYCYAI
jgi:hypothetical protein